MKATNQRETLKMLLNNPQAAIVRLAYNPLRRIFIPDGGNYRELNSNKIYSADEVRQVKNCFAIVPASQAN